MATIPVSSLKWPIELDESGKFALAGDIYDTWAQRVKALLSTRLGERVMRTDYGCGIVDDLFDPVSAMDPEQQVRVAMGKWLPRLTVTNVLVSSLGSQVRIEVTYRTPDGSTQQVAQAFQKGVFE